VTWIDETNDVAVLSARGLRDATLQLTAQVRPGVQGAIIGFPGAGPVLGQPMRSEPVEIIGSARVTLDEEGRTRDRVVTEFRHRRGLRTEGFSGGPLVDSTRRVNGIVSGEFGLGQGRWQPFVAPVQAIAHALAQPHRPIRGRTCKRRR